MPDGVGREASVKKGGDVGLLEGAVIFLPVGRAAAEDDSRESTDVDPLSNAEGWWNFHAGDFCWRCGQEHCDLFSWS